MSRNLSIIMALFFVFSCKKDHHSGDQKILVGTWNWQSSTLINYCVGWEIYNPENINTRYKVVFQKKGIVQFYENDNLLSEHKIKFELFSVQHKVIVESYQEFSFTILLDGDPAKKLRGSGTPNDFQLSGFPFGPDEGCVLDSHNHFRKE